MENIFNYFYSYPVQTWFILGAIFMALEMILGMTIVMFYSGISCFTLAILINFNLAPANNLSWQITLYFTFLVIWAVVLWKPTKNLMKRKYGSSKGYDNIIGDSAIIYGEDLEKNKVGKIKWSGTICKAMIDNEYEKSLIPKDSTVKVTGMKDNVFIVELTE